jgi:hypothetical protein
MKPRRTQFQLINLKGTMVNSNYIIVSCLRVWKNYYNKYKYICNNRVSIKHRNLKKKKKKKIKTINIIKKKKKKKKNPT